MALQMRVEDSGNDVVFIAFPKYVSEQTIDKLYRALNGDTLGSLRKTVDEVFAEGERNAKNPGSVRRARVTQVEELAPALYATLSFCGNARMRGHRRFAGRLPRDAAPFPLKEKPKNEADYYFVRLELAPAPKMKLRKDWKDMPLLRCSLGKVEEFENAIRSNPAETDYSRWRETDEPAAEDKFVWYRVFLCSDAELKNRVNVMQLVSRAPAVAARADFPYAPYLWGMKAGEKKRVPEAWFDCGVEVGDVALDKFLAALDMGQSVPEGRQAEFKIEDGRLKTLRRFEIEVVKVLAAPQGEKGEEGADGGEKDDSAAVDPKELAENEINLATLHPHAMNAIMAEMSLRDVSDLIVPPGFPTFVSVFRSGVLLAVTHPELPARDLLLRGDMEAFRQFLGKDPQALDLYARIYLGVEFYQALAEEALGKDAKLTESDVAFAQRWPKNFSPEASAFPLLHDRLQALFPDVGVADGMYEIALREKVMRILYDRCEPVDVKIDAASSRFAALANCDTLARFLCMDLNVNGFYREPDLRAHFGDKPPLA